AIGASRDLSQTVDHALGYARSLLRDPVTAMPRAATAPEPSPLSPREREVLAAIATGASNKEIAATLCLSVKTVMHHSVSIYRKLGVRGRGEATALAHRTGLVQHPPADQPWQ